VAELFIPLLIGGLLVPEWLSVVFSESTSRDSFSCVSWVVFG